MTQEDPDLYNAKLLEAYKAGISRQELYWRALHDQALHSDRAAIEIGLGALRTAVLVNAGAIVALLAFVGQLWGRYDQLHRAVLGDMKPFVIGLGTAGLASAVAYLYQSFATARAFRDLAEESEGAEKLKPTKWEATATVWTGAAMIGLAGISYGAFIWGSLNVTNLLVGR